MNLFRWLSRTPKPPRGLHADEAAVRWAEERFPDHSRAVAAYVAYLLCEQIGLTLPEIEPGRRFIEDLRIDEETVEFVMAMEEDLNIQIPDTDAGKLNTVADLVEYLRGRLRPSAGSVADPS